MMISAAPNYRTLGIWFFGWSNFGGTCFTSSDPFRCMTSRQVLVAGVLQVSETIFVGNSAPNISEGFVLLCFFGSNLTDNNHTHIVLISLVHIDIPTVVWWVVSGKNAGHFSGKGHNLGHPACKELATQCIMSLVTTDSECYR